VEDNLAARSRAPGDGFRDSVSWQHGAIYRGMRVNGGTGHCEPLSSQFSDFDHGRTPHNNILINGSDTSADRGPTFGCAHLDTQE
jgi:hypothetical protein